MTRYRIIRRPGYATPTRAIYEVEKRVLWWWEDCGGIFLTLEDAKKEIERQRAAEAIKRQVVYTEP